MILKKILTSSLLVFFISPSGCASLFLYDGFSPTSIKEETKVLGQDNMIAIGQSIKDDKNTGLVFIGENYTYLIKDDYEKFYSLLKEFPASDLIFRSELPITFKFDSSSKFQGYISFRYKQPISQIPQSKLIRLKELGFDERKTSQSPNSESYLYGSFDYQGQLYTATNSEDIKHQFSKPYPIILTEDIRIKKVNSGKIGKTIVLTPLAIAFDIATLPVSLPLAIYVIKVADSWNH